MLDASKAFDKIVHSLLCSELMERDVPSTDVRLALLFHMLCSLTAVDYGRVRSSSFPLASVVRQGIARLGDSYGQFISTSC